MVAYGTDSAFLIALFIYSFLVWYIAAIGRSDGDGRPFLS